jgi:tRNA (Thr-GGU) A37 N-methylase
MRQLNKFDTAIIIFHFSLSQLVALIRRKARLGGAEALEFPKRRR